MYQLPGFMFLHRIEKGTWPFDSTSLVSHASQAARIS